MKKTKKNLLPKELQKALNQFPKIVASNKTRHAKKQKFIEETFGELARKIYREVHGKKTQRGRSGA